MLCQSNGFGKNYLAIGNRDSIVINNYENAFNKASKFIKEQEDWVFGFFSYDLKNDCEQVESSNDDHLEFPYLLLFRPEIVVEIDNFDNNVYKVIHAYSNYDDGDIKLVINSLSKLQSRSNRDINKRINSRISKKEYLSNVENVLEHIQLGDIYEMNYCQEFFINDVHLDSNATYSSLVSRTNAPYSCFLQWEDKYMMCASPELFLKKEGTRVISKPIKGTKQRSKDPIEDNRLKEELKNDKKEIAENVMIVDVVRNDLSRTAMKNSIVVRELCEIYSFDTVHQMISTVESQIEPSTDPIEVIKKAFPMGSMTGAPKIRAMELIDKYESFARGLYSGAAGYFEPNGDFTLNVIIRSILYNESKRYCSMSVGGAITALSVPSKEYDETLLKANALFKSITIRDVEDKIS